MSRWFRHYAGLCRDGKMVSVALKAKQPIERVIWVWCAILESAAEIDNDGRYSLDAAEVAYFLRADEVDILAIEEGLTVASRLSSGSVVKWSNRQFKSDKSAERVAAHRERRRADDGYSRKDVASQNSDVTLQKRYGNAPETELETDTERRDDAVTPAPARATALAKIEPACLALIAGTDWPVATAQDWHALTRLAVDDGLDVESEILPAIRQQVERAKAAGKRISTWGYFANGCREFARQARSPPPPMSPVTPRNFNAPGAQNAKQPSPMRAALDRLAATARGDFSPDQSNARTIDGDYTIAGSA